MDVSKVPPGKGGIEGKPASQVDVFDHLLSRFADLKAKNRILERTLKRVLQDHGDMGTLSPHTLGMIRSALLMGEKEG